MNIDYTLARTSDVSMEVYDMVGNKIQSIKINSQSAGSHTYTMNATDLAKGAYLVRLISSNGIATQRMIKL
jgi:flagellar hook assembly protein FlgD